MGHGHPLYPLSVSASASVSFLLQRVEHGVGVSRLLVLARPGLRDGLPEVGGRAVVPVTGVAVTVADALKGAGGNKRDMKDIGHGGADTGFRTKCRRFVAQPFLLFDLWYVSFDFLGAGLRTSCTERIRHT